MKILRNSRREGRFLYYLALPLILTACAKGAPLGTVVNKAQTLPNSLAHASPTVFDCPIQDFRDSILSSINAARAAGQVCAGVAFPAAGALVWNAQLEAAASRHSTDMASNDFFAHQGLDERRVGSRVVAAGYTYTHVGENIAAGQSSTAQVANDWLASKEHCINLMKASHVDIGASCKYQPTSTYQYYWTLVMAKNLY